MSGLNIIIAATIVAAITSFIVCKIMNDVFLDRVYKVIENMHKEIKQVTVETIRKGINNK